MAKLSFSQIVLVMIALVGVFAGGCQSNTSVTGQPLPAPSFAGPVLVPRPATVWHATPPMAAMPRAPKAAPLAEQGVPRDWVPEAAPRAWRWIVIHHSATTYGCAARFDADHRAKGWDELGYHFVIGNGTESGDGQVEVGPRWPIQKHGAHAKTPSEEFNNFGIGICLVGNFDEDHPTAAEMRSCAKLVAYLMRTYHIPPDHVIGHNDTKPTDCPGRYMSVATVRAMAMAINGQSSYAAAPSRVRTAQTTELLEPAGQ